MVPGVANDANDFPNAAMAVDLLANGIAVGKVEPGEGLIDNDNFRRGLRILRAEVATGQDANAERSEVVGTDHVIMGLAVLSALRYKSGNDDVGASFRSGEEAVSREGGRLHAWHGGHAFQELAAEPP